MKGNQIPRLRVEPERVYSDSPDAVELITAYSFTPFPWQRLVMESWLGCDSAGEYTATTCGLLVPRQNGKNGCLEIREFFGMLFNADRILHTAHLTKTSKKSFYRLEHMFTDPRHPEILEQVKAIRYTNGEEAIELKNGARIEFATRTRSSARGFDGITLIVYDEAQELTDDQIEATMATLAASATGKRQIIYAGTPPYPGCPGTVFMRFRNDCLKDPAKNSAWHEWSVAGKSVEEINTEDVNLWYDSNPSLGYSLTEEFTRTELGQMSKDGFCRERLGWCPPEENLSADLAIDSAAWSACKSLLRKPEGKTAYGIKFTYDGSEVILCGAVIPSEGAARISLIDRKPTGYGLQWLADWLNMRYSKACCVVIDGKNGADVLVEKLTPVWKAKDSIIRPGGKQILAAVSTLTNALSERTVTWYYEQNALEESALESIKRPIAGGWGFGGENSGPIEAASLALWGAKTAKRDPNKKMRIG